MAGSEDHEGHADPQEAAALLRRLLKAVERGEITADSPRAVALLRRLEGALSALETLPNETGR